MLDLSAYKNPALQFSGGKDSLALLYMCREQLDSITVYRVDTGDSCEETLQVVEAVRSWIPHFVEVNTDSKAWRKENGMPSDLVPASATLLGTAYGMGDARVCGRFDCCAANLMIPLHERMLADKVDAVIRGTKQCDAGKIPAVGKTPWYDILLPLADWSHAQVFDYLKAAGAPANALYEYCKGASGPECLTCTAWWDDGRSEYLKAKHPTVYQEYRVNLLTIARGVSKHLEQLDKELA